MSWAKHFLKFVLVSSVIAAPCAFGQEEPVVRELWRGTFEQESPMPWSGTMELFIRYSPGEDFPQRIEGVLTWGGLGQARTRVIGQRSETVLHFKETDCLESNCSFVVLGGVYRGEFSDDYQEFSGKAKHSRAGLRGNFSLRRVLDSE